VRPELRKFHELRVLVILVQVAEFLGELRVGNQLQRQRVELVFRVRIRPKYIRQFHLGFQAEQHVVPKEEIAAHRHHVPRHAIVLGVDAAGPNQLGVDGAEYGFALGVEGREAGAQVRAAFLQAVAQDFVGAAF
jgi:hypothetical protein